MIISTLGSLSINLHALQSRSGSRAYTYAEHAVIEGKPVLQWVGDALKSESLTLHFSAAFGDPQAELDAWRAEAERHESLPFVTAEGQVLGSFVVEEIAESPNKTFQDGHLMDAVITVKLKEHVGGAGQAVRTPTPTAPVRVRNG